MVDNDGFNFMLVSVENDTGDEIFARMDRTKRAIGTKQKNLNDRVLHSSFRRDVSSLSREREIMYVLAMMQLLCKISLNACV